MVHTYRLVYEELISLRSGAIPLRAHLILDGGGRRRGHEGRHMPANLTYQLDNLLLMPQAHACTGEHAPPALTPWPLRLATCGTANRQPS